MNNLQHMQLVLNNEWELLELENNAVLLNSIFGKQIHIKKHGNFVKSLVSHCTGQNNYQKIIDKTRSELPQVQVDSIIQTLKKLIDANILIDSVNDYPKWLTKNIHDRFHNMLDVFAHRTSDMQLSLEAFNTLRKADITIIGVGGHGSLTAVMCAAMGVGKLTLVDGDQVEESNLVRQIFYTQADVINKEYKVDSLSRFIQNFSEHTSVEVKHEYISSQDDIYPLIENKSFVFLCADAPRFTLNRWFNQACIDSKVPYINAFAGLIGPLTVANLSPCFACLEHEYRKQLGPLHDEIVNALQAQRSRQYPSIVLGPTLIATLQTQEMLAYLTKLWQPRTLDGYLSCSNGMINHHKIIREHPCKICEYQ